MRREENYGWLYGIVAGSCVAAMQIGVGMLQMDRDYAILLGAAQGLLVCSLTVICGGILVWILRPLPMENEEAPNPVQQRLRDYREAFGNLAVSFAGEGQKAEAVPENEQLDKTEKMKLLWKNRLEENRAAVAIQLGEMAQIMTDTVEYAWDTRPDEELEQVLAKKLKGMGLCVHSVLVYQEEHRRQEVYLTVSTRRRKCVATKDIAEVLSRMMKKAMMPGKDSRAFVGSEKVTVLFAERTNFQVLCGVEKAVKSKETISGDNFSLHRCREGQFIGALSDGMGSGMAAYRDSEMVIDLLEQFLGSGFDKETAIRLIHSSMLLQTEGQSSATVDLCMADLYTGDCEFLKIGASTTFLKRKHWVETITSTSMPMGILQDVDYECTRKRLEEGDYIVMVSDGVMDAEEMIKDYLLQSETENAKELARSLLNYVLQSDRQQARDDMTVLVGGMRRR